MKPPDRRTNTPAMTLTTHWSPKQARAVFEALDALRDLVWGQYGCQIQQAIRKDRTQSRRLGKGSYKNMDRGTEPF